MADSKLLIEPLVLDPSDFPPLPLEPGFTQLANDTLGNAATELDGFDSVFADAAAILDALDNALSELGGADGGTLDDTFEEILQFDPADAGGHVVEASAAIADAGTNVDKLGNQLAAASLPAPGGGGGGGSAPPSSDCSKRTNQYGLSKTGSFPGVNCDWQLTFQILRVQDGACTYSAAPGAGVGATTLPTIVSFTLQSGSTAVWKLGHHTARASDGTPYDVVDVGITPAAPGHYDAVGVLAMQRPGRTWHVCMSVDVIS